ncbi:MAG: hypothetical protein ACOYJ1_01005 [Peptococcales bacterium]|jgi:hypothetical protein
MDTYKVYVKTDAEGRITAINSDAFIPAEELSSWTYIDEGSGDKYHHAQGNYFTEKPLYSEQGIPNYKLIGGAVLFRTDEEIQADVDAIPPAPYTPTNAEIYDLLQALAGGDE